jgi:hypothetical protein
VSSSWAAPDPRPAAATPPVFGEPPVAPDDPPLHREVVAAAVTAVAVLLCGPVVGLLWAFAAPRADLVADGDGVRLRDQETSAFIAVDGLFLAAVVASGVLTGLLAWWLARRYGLGVVIGLAIGGLAAAVLARVVGEAVGTSVAELLGQPAAGGGLDAGRDIPDDLAFRLRAPEALVGWPVAALLSFVAASVLAGRSHHGPSPNG